MFVLFVFRRFSRARSPFQKKEKKKEKKMKFASSVKFEVQVQVQLKSLFCNPGKARVLSRRLGRAAATAGLPDSQAGPGLEVERRSPRRYQS